MKKHFLKNGENWTFGDLPMEENGVKSVSSQITEEELQQIEDGTHDPDIVAGKIKLKASNRKAERLNAEQIIQQNKDELGQLKEKLANNSATLEEIQQTLAKLL